MLQVDPCDRTDHVTGLPQPSKMKTAEVVGFAGPGASGDATPSTASFRCVAFWLPLVLGRLCRVPIRGTLLARWGAPFPEPGPTARTGDNGPRGSGERRRTRWTSPGRPSTRTRLGRRTHVLTEAFQENVSCVRKLLHRNRCGRRRLFASGAMAVRVQQPRSFPVGSPDLVRCCVQFNAEHSCGPDKVCFEHSPQTSDPPVPNPGSRRPEQRHQPPGGCHRPATTVSASAATHTRHEPHRCSSDRSAF